MLCLLGTGYLNTISCWYAKLPQRSTVVASNKVLAKRLIENRTLPNIPPLNEIFHEMTPTMTWYSIQPYSGHCMKTLSKSFFPSPSQCVCILPDNALAADRLWSRYTDIGSIVTTDQSSPCFRHHVGASAKNTRQEWQKTTELETDVSTRNRIYHKYNNNKYNNILWINANFF